MKVYTAVEQFRHRLRGLAGSVIDLYHIVDVSFVNPHSYTKFRQIRAVQRRTGARTFVEAGTLSGLTAARCAPIFAQVYTIELDQELARRATSYLAPLPNVRVIQGDAPFKLPELLGNSAVRDALLFLDGHYSGAGTTCGDLPEPAVEILPLIAPYQAKIKAVIIDDFRSFGTEPGYPKKSALLEQAERYFAENSFDLSVNLDQVILRRIL
jgi:hypothetical protein